MVLLITIIIFIAIWRLAKYNDEHHEEIKRDESCNFRAIDGFGNDVTHLFDKKTQRNRKWWRRIFDDGGFGSSGGVFPS